jgi:hypothetical protein
MTSLDEREMRLEPNAIYWRGQPPLDSVTVSLSLIIKPAF